MQMLLAFCIPVGPDGVKASPKIVVVPSENRAKPARAEVGVVYEFPNKSNLYNPVVATVKRPVAGDHVKLLSAD